MSWENWACVTCKGASRAAWQSKHVLGACAPAPPTQTHTVVNNRISDLGKMLFSRVCIECHRDNKAQSENAGAENEFPAALAARLVEEWQQQPNNSGHAKYQDAQDISVGKPHLCRNLLECLKH